MPMFQVSELWGMTDKLESCHRVSSLWSTLSCLILIFFRFIFTFVLHVLIFCLHVRMCITRIPGTGGGQKTASDPRNWRHRQLWLTMWVLWKSPLKKQPVLLTDGSSIQLCLRTLVMTVLKCTPVCVLSSCQQDLKCRDPYSLQFTIQACPVQYWNIQQTLNMYSTMESSHFRIKGILAFIWSHPFTVQMRKQTWRLVKPKTQGYGSPSSSVLLWS